MVYDDKRVYPLNFNWKNSIDMILDDSNLGDPEVIVYRKKNIPDSIRASKMVHEHSE